MRHSLFMIFTSSLALGSIAVGIAGTIHEKRKARKHQPSAKLRDLYEDNAASGSSILKESGDF